MHDLDARLDIALARLRSGEDVADGTVESMQAEYDAIEELGEDYET